MSVFLVVHGRACGKDLVPSMYVAAIVVVELRRLLAALGVKLGQETKVCHVGFMVLDSFLPPPSLGACTHSLIFLRCACVTVEWWRPEDA